MLEESSWLSKGKKEMQHHATLYLATLIGFLANGVAILETVCSSPAKLGNTI
jgi:hypothetical protein